MKTTFTCPTCLETKTRVHTAGKPPRYCSRACSNQAPGRMTEEVRQKISRSSYGPMHANFKGTMTSAGRVLVWLPREDRGLYPTAHANGYILRYHLVWNAANPTDMVQKGELIHHKNEDSMDDRLENLEKMTDQSKHWSHHAPLIAAGRPRNAKGRFL